MLPDFRATVAALADSIAADHPDKHRPDTVAAVTRYLLETQRRTPDYIALAFRCLTLLFDASAVLVAGRPFHALDGTARAARIRAWERSRLGFRRDFVTYYRSLATFALYSEVYRRDFQPGPVPHDA